MKDEIVMSDEELLKNINAYNEIVIFGATNVGWYLYEYLIKKKADCRISICDNSHVARQDERVLSVEQIVALYKNAVYLLTSSIHEGTMSRQLLSLDVSKDRIILAITKESLDYDYNCKEKQKFEPLKKLQFEVNLTTHCNLNCKCCSQFSCIAEEEYLDVDALEKDLKRLGELFDGEMERIFLIGGEPLLHPNIVECMRIARRCFPVGLISVFTNGLLLLSCKNEFWQACRKYNISITVTKYPINLDYERVQKKANLEDVKFEFFGASEDFKYMTNLNLDPYGQQDIRKSFVECKESNYCIKLCEGKLYTCSRPHVIHIFNKYFGKNFVVSEEDYVDIYKEKSGQEILKKLARPIPFCRYCNPIKGRTALEWGQTEKDIHEWLCE